MLEASDISVRPAGRHRNGAMPFHLPMKVDHHARSAQQSWLSRTLRNASSGFFCYVYETSEKDMTRSDYTCGMAEKVEKHLQFVLRHITFSTPLSWCHLQTGNFVIRQLQLLFDRVNLYSQEGELCWWANCFFSGAVGKPSLAGLVCGQGGWCLVCWGCFRAPERKLSR